MLCLHQKLKKHRSRVTNASGIRSIIYDRYGNLNEENIQVGSLRYTTQEHWDAYGRSTGYVLQKNGTRACGVSQAYGTYGRIAVASFIHANVEHKFHYGYLPGSDLLQTLSMPNGVTLTQEYEEKRNLLTGMDYVRENSLVTQRRYTYDAIARPETRDTHYPNKGISHNDSFAYNHRSELTGALLDNSAYTYAYDNIGNREIAQEAAEGITYAANELNQYTRISTDGENFMPEYDADGNQTLVQTSTGIWHVTYNAQNRAVKFESADGSAIITCAYDYMGRRFEKQVVSNGTITTHQRFIYRNYLQIAAVNLKEDAPTPDLWFLIWDPTQPVATRPLAIRKDGTWYTYGWDLTKNVCELYGQQGYIRTMYRYSPYGTVTAEGDVQQAIQWSSEMCDGELGLIYYNYRYYNSQDGSWLSREPIGIGGGINLYGYLQNAITRWIDFLGLHKFDPTWGHNDKVFLDWYHKVYKKGIEGRNASKEILDEAYQEWLDSGCPDGDQKKQNSGTRNRGKNKRSGRGNNNNDDDDDLNSSSGGYWEETDTEESSSSQDGQRWQVVSGVGMIIAGGFLIIGTIVEDVLSAGIGAADDPASISAGMWLIRAGARLAF